MSKHVPSAAATGPQGPRDLSARIRQLFGRKPVSGPLPGDPDGDGDDDTTASGQDDDANPVS